MCCFHAGGLLCQASFNIRDTVSIVVTYVRVNGIFPTHPLLFCPRWPVCQPRVSQVWVCLKWRFQVINIPLMRHVNVRSAWRSPTDGRGALR